MKTRYAYVPFNRGATLTTDAVHSATRTPAGQVLCTKNGTEPMEGKHDLWSGRYAQRVTYAQLRKAGFSVNDLRFARGEL